MSPFCTYLYEFFWCIYAPKYLYICIYRCAFESHPTSLLLPLRRVVNNSKEAM